ncbi:MAG: glutamine-hydrolyzing carbamoyl-phosphate synthase small subunit [Holophagales bacterium]|jgi:carbamoyl-phosphate synthase small subunit|nr:glutamine-hydrolyzing carbamoyl-phosphate synthase small subunit [Holophagales bacterium]
MRAHLILKDGTVFRGRSPLGFGGSGEAVFTTSMTGYQEILTDPSFYGQLVTMTFPEQGIYGIHRDLQEADHPWARGLLCRRLTSAPDHAFAETNIADWLRKHRVPIMTDLDTRALTLRIRDKGAQPAIIWTEADGSLGEGAKRASTLPDMAGQALCAAVSCRERWEIPKTDAKFRVAVLDGGVKASILNLLSRAGLRLEIFPWDTPADELLAPRFDGIFLSNGPGDPAALPSMQREVAKLIGNKPIFGICLGHQLLAHALGGSTFKLPFGHRGANQPVIDLDTKRIEITAQNHGFAVDENSLPNDVEVTHRHLSDGTVEGMRHRKLPVFSLQHHPEASPGPHDARGAFVKFTEIMSR